MGEWNLIKLPDGSQLDMINNSYQFEKIPKATRLYSSARLTKYWYILIEIKHRLQSTVIRMCVTIRNPIDFSVVIWFQVAGKRDLDQEAEAQQWIEAVTGEKFAPGKYYKYYYTVTILYWYLDKHMPNPVVLNHLV